MSDDREDLITEARRRGAVWGALDFLQRADQRGDVLDRKRALSVHTKVADMQASPCFEEAASACRRSAQEIFADLVKRLQARAAR